MSCHQTHTMEALADLVAGWNDLVLGAQCVGCGVPGRWWCSSCQQMVDERIVARPVAMDLDFPSFCSGEYDDWLRELIVLHKEHAAWALCRPLGNLLGRATSHLVLPHQTAVLVPIPSRPSAVRRRGYDSTARMTRSAAEWLRCRGQAATMLPALRLRVPVKDSVGLNLAQRRRNLADAFAVRPRMLSRLRQTGSESPHVIVICDDVLTTGATLREAGHALELIGVKPFGAAVVAAVSR